MIQTRVVPAGVVMVGAADVTHIGGVTPFHAPPDDLWYIRGLKAVTAMSGVPLGASVVRFILITVARAPALSLKPK